MKVRPPTIAIGSGVVLLLLGALIQIFSRSDGMLENNFVTLQFYRDHPGISIMLLGAFVALIGSLLSQSAADRTSAGGPNEVLPQASARQSWSSNQGGAKMEGQIRRSVVWGVVGALIGALLGFYYGSSKVSAIAVGASSSFPSADSDELFILLCTLLGSAVLGFGVFMLAHVLLDRR